MIRLQGLVPRSIAFVALPIKVGPSSGRQRVSTSGIHSNKSYNLVLKFDSEGYLDWEARSYINDQNQWNNGLVLSDGNLMAVGSGGPWSGEDGRMVISKMTSEGRVLWEKQFEDYVYSQGLDILETKDGNIAILGIGSDSLGIKPKAILWKIDTAGVVLWEKHYRESATNIRHYNTRFTATPRWGLCAGCRTRRV